MIAYLHGYLAIFIRYGDHAAARRNGWLHVCIARKAKARKVALRGRYLIAPYL